MLTKLTLSADPEVVALAKALAAEQGTSVSVLFAHFVRTAAQRHRRAAPRGTPVLRRLRGVVRLPAGRTDRELLEDALLDRHGLR